MPQQDQQFKYVRLPNGSYGKFKADATTEEMRAAVIKMFPNAYAQQPQKITDPNTIGPQKPPTPVPTEALSTGGVIKRYSGLEGLGNAQDKLVSLLPDNVKELLFGGQAAGKPMGTRSGLVNNPVTQAMSLAPGAASTANDLTRLVTGKNELIARILRGPGAVGDIEGVPSILKRELEPRIARNEPPGVRSEMYDELAQRKVARGAEQESLDKAQQATQRESELALQKQLESVDKMIREEIEKHRGFAEGAPGPSKPLSESPYATQAKEASRLEAAERQPVPLSESPYAGRQQRVEASLKEAETARMKELEDFGRLRTMDERLAAREGRPVPLSRSPYATQQSEQRAFTEGKTGPFNLRSASPNRPPAVEGEAEAGGAGPQAPGGAPAGQDLITRTRALVKPGETPTAADLKRAGDLTQAPIGRLRTLAKFGDKLAENEINRRLQNITLSAAAPLTAAIPQLKPDGSVHYASTGTGQLSPMRGFGVQGANIESPSGKKISYFASAGSPKPPKSGTLGEMAYDDKKGHLLAWNGAKWVEADDANRQEIRDKIAGDRAHLVGEYYKGGHLTKDQVMIFAKQKLIGMKDARSIVNGPQEKAQGQ